MGAIASVGGPDRQADGGSCSVVPGLVEAVKALCEPTALQRTLDPAVSESEPINKGRIVCLTSLARYHSGGGYLTQESQQPIREA